MTGLGLIANANLGAGASGIT
ncbi:protein of unknown function [Ralstonia solanacearum CFBP2957]|nr:protein of unknown function [Ralstonia solanacearum CFBP2957]